MERLLKFLRSVLPADPAQLIFLAGVVCLSIAPHLRWWPSESSDIVSWYTPEFAQQSRTQWWFFLAIVIWLIHFASAAGFFISFWPGQRPRHRISRLVLFPAIAGLSIISGRFIHIYLPRFSIFAHNSSRFSKSVDWSRIALWDLGAGFRICLLGIGLILIFTIRMSLGLTTLPITLSSFSGSAVEDESWRRAKKLIWFVATPLVLLASAIIVIPVVGFQGSLSHSASPGIMLYIQYLEDVLSSFTLIGIAIWISGAPWWHAIRRSLRWFNPIYLALSLFIPFVLDASFPVGRYLYDYMYWGAHNYGHFAPPEFWTYFTVPHFSYVWLVFAALAEEIIFRAVIQPKLIQRYGIWRGLFLVGIIWSAFHFHSDFHARMTELNVASALGMRILVCLSLGFVLGWLTLRSGSIWPAVIAHALYNVLLYSGFAFQFTGEEIVRPLLWAVLACVLFRYWPPQEAAAVDAYPDLPSDLIEIGPA